MSKRVDLSVPEAARFLLSEERMQRFVDLYRRAAASGDSRIAAAADEAIKYFVEAEGALSRMLAAEAAVTRQLEK